jgi:arginyl-tRNA synthetase
MEPVFVSAHASLQQWLSASWQAVHGVPFPAHAWSACPRLEWGHLTHAAAQQAARALRQSPHVVAQAWVAHLPPHPLVSEVSVVGPGHVNLRLSNAGLAAMVHEALEVFETVPVPPPTLIEFVSANPTGPLHLGHARQAVLGDVLARLLRSLGGQVATEFFYNDAGVQIEWLETSIRLRLLELAGTVLLFERDGATPDQVGPGQTFFPAATYHGDYVIELAKAWNGDGDLRAFAIQEIQQEQKADLAAMGVNFDGYLSEKSLHANGNVARVVEALQPHAYRALQPNQAHEPAPEGAELAWFLETSKWGDDKDRVMVKADGSVTYFVPDVAYHLNKWKRGWTRAINIQGADHHGTLARVQAGVQAVDPSIGPGYPHVIFHTMIKVMKDRQPVKASKRAGGYVTARQVLDLIGPDAFRLSMLEKKPDAPMVLDVDLWLSESDRNPAYGLQVANARLCKALERMKIEAPGNQSLPGLAAVEETTIIELALLGPRLQAAALDLDPVKAAAVGKAFAETVNRLYFTGPKLLELDGPSRQTRVGLYKACIHALLKVSQTLGISLPQWVEPAPVTGVQSKPSPR